MSRFTLSSVVSLLIVINVVALLLHQQKQAGVNAQCSENTELQFKPKAAPDGVLSYISQAGDTGPTVYFENPTQSGARPLPPVILQAVDVANGRALDLTKDGSLVVCTSEPPLRMGGSSVELNRGTALFSSLTILETLRPGFNYSLTFTMKVETTGTIYSANSPRLEMVSRSESPVSIRFKNYGFFIRSGFPKAIPVNTSIPKFWIEVVGRTGYPVAAAGVSIQLDPMIVRDTGERVPGGAVSPSGPFTGADSIEFAGISYYMPYDPLLQAEVESSGVAFNFTSSFGAFVETGSLSVVTQITRNRFMQFDSVNSFIRYDNEGSTAVLNIPMPSIIINLFTSQMGFDGSNTGTVILAESNQAKLQGAEALVIRGVATFADLTFVGFAPRSAVITFSTVLPDGTPAKLFSGAISVTDSAIKASRIRFTSPESKINDNTEQMSLYAIPRGTGGEFTLPLVSVFFVDSANRYDLTAHQIELELQLDPPANFQTTMSVRKKSDWGSVVWDKMTFVTTQPSNTTFSVRIVDPSNIRTTLVSAKLTLLRSDLSVSGALSPCFYKGWCPLKLKFHNEYGTRSSAVDAEDVPVFTTAGSLLPTIVLSLTDWFGPIYERSGASGSVDLTASSLRVKAYTQDVNNELLLDTAGGATTGVYQNGLFYFQCLRLPSATGLVRINFAALSFTNDVVYEGLGRPRTGFTTVLTSPISGYSIRFAPAGLLQYAGKSTSAVVGVALPPVVFEVVDSQNKHDAADTSVTVVATTSTGETTSPVKAQKGLINFTLVQFFAGAENPTVTFSVTSSNNPVAGQTLTTGPIRLSTLPIPLYQVAFDNSRGSTSMFSSAFESKTVLGWGATDATIDVTLVLRDSAHENAKDLLGYSIRVDVLSDDASIAQPQQVFFDTTCNCAKISTVINGVKAGVSSTGGPVHLKYRIAEGPALLVGQVLVAGPISVAGTGASCGGGGGGTSEVVAEIREPLDTFKTNIPTIASQIASALGVESARVVIEPNATQVSRTGYKDLQTYAVTKSRVAFLNPLATSTIRKSRTDLAEEFMQIRPACDLPELKLWNVYGTAQDRDCDIPKFIAGIATAKQCTTSGRSPMCECYENGVVREQGATCGEVPQLQSQLITMCMEIRSTCQNSGIQSLCSNVLIPKRSSMAWAWATLGGIAGVVGIGYAYYRRRLAKQRQTLVLGSGG